MSSGESFFMADEWLHDKRLSWSNRALLSKLYALTQQGTIEKQVTNQFFFEMGFTEKEMRNSWKVLQACGYISKRIDKIEGNKCYVSFLPASSCPKIDTLSPKGREATAQRSKGSCPKVDTLPPKGRYSTAQRASHHTVSNTNSNTLVNLSNTYSEHTEKNEIPQKALLKRTSFKPRQSLNYNKSLTTNFVVNYEKIPTAQVGRFYS